MIKVASGLLSSTPPITVMLGDIVYHPEAIMLAAKPTPALTQVYNAVRAATQNVTGKRNPDRNARRWIPHGTVCYSTSTQRAEPIITTLGQRLPTREIHISAVSLVIQHGPERLWGWHTVGAVRLPTPIPHLPGRSPAAWRFPIPGQPWQPRSGPGVRNYLVPLPRLTDLPGAGEPVDQEGPAGDLATGTTGSCGPCVRSALQPRRPVTPSSSFPTTMP